MCLCNSKKSQTMKTQRAHRSRVIIAQIREADSGAASLPPDRRPGPLHPAGGSPAQLPAMCFPGLDPAPRPASLHLCTKWPRRQKVWNFTPQGMNSLPCYEAQHSFLLGTLTNHAVPSKKEMENPGANGKRPSGAEGIACGKRLVQGIRAQG